MTSATTLSAVSWLAIVDDDRRTAGGEFLGVCKSEALATSGDYRDLVVEMKFSLCLEFIDVSAARALSLLRLW